MTYPSPAALMRHRGPALLLQVIDACDGRALTCTSRTDGPWPWPRMLEVAAQTAGLLPGMQPGGLARNAVVAQYRDVLLHADADSGPLVITAFLEPRVLHFWSCRFEVRGRDGGPVLEGRVRLAAPRGG